LADFGAPGSRAAELCPRRLLKRTIAKAEGMGFKPMFGMEFEWFNFKETPQSLADKGHTRPTPLTPGMFGYSLLRSSQNHEYFRAIMDEMEMFNVPIEGLHTETGPGVYEAALTYSDALEAGDRAVLFKAGLKEIAHRFGIMPSFMAKWNEKLPGCSGHMHQSLVNAEGVNAFYDGDAQFKMSDTFKHYLAGQLLLLPEVLPCYAPTINSYKRLVEGMWAPTKVTWGVDNRTVGLRVIPGSSKSTRLETRVSGSDVNPYISIAAALACGLYGIEHKLELRDVPVVGNGYAKEDAIRLPANLKEAAEKMAGSKVAREVLGDAFVDHLTQTRLWEWRQFQSVVTDWEMRRYFEII
jgi:glutamine synthetase